MAQSDQCLLCKHYRLLGECDAFPDGIPDAIFSGGHDHAIPLPGDHGILFEPVDNLAEEVD